MELSVEGSVSQFEVTVISYDDKYTYTVYLFVFFSFINTYYSNCKVKN